VAGVPADLSITESIHYPTNQGEYATYELTVKPNYEVTKLIKLQMIFQFPAEYIDGLIDHEIVYKCSSVPASNKCYPSNDRTFVFETFADTVKATKTMKFTIFGISNPGFSSAASATTSNMSAYLINADSKQVLSRQTNAAGFSITNPPKLLNMTYVDADDKATNTETTYKFGFNTIDTEVKSASGAIWIDWPNEYVDSNVLAGGYSCAFTENISGNPSCQFQDQTRNKRVEIKGFSDIAKASKELKMEFYKVPTLHVPGETDEWIIRTYDITSKAVLERSYPSTSVEDTVTFVQGQNQATTN
jgi:hypothetical protein